MLRLCHFCSNSGSNSLNIRSNISAGNVRNLCDNACWLTCVGSHHRNPSLASILLSSLTPATSRQISVSTAATISGRFKILSLIPSWR
jgi:hypothetical protein